jgi:hypothetical protein
MIFDFILDLVVCGYWSCCPHFSQGPSKTEQPPEHFDHISRITIRRSCARAVDALESLEREVLSLQRAAALPKPHHHQPAGFATS